jgi:hypothetical protein
MRSAKDLGRKDQAFCLGNAVATNSNLKNDPTIEAKVQLASTVLVVLYYITFALSFS